MSTSIISAYEQPIRKMEDEKLVIHENIANCGRPLKGYDETYRIAVEFLATPFTVWASDQFEHKHAVLKLAFADKLTYGVIEPLKPPYLSRC